MKHDVKYPLNETVHRSKPKFKLGCTSVQHEMSCSIYICQMRALNQLRLKYIIKRMLDVLLLCFQQVRHLSLLNHSILKFLVLFCLNWNLFNINLKYYSFFWRFTDGSLRPILTHWMILLPFQQQLKACTKIIWSQ